MRSRTPGRGELDRERQAVEPADDLGDGGGVLGGQREVLADGHGPLEEQPHRLRPGDRLEVGLAGGRNGRAAGPANSCSPAIRSGARLDTIIRSFGAASQDLGHDRRARHDLLEVVEDDQRRAIPKCSTTRSSGVRVGAEQADRRGDRPCRLIPG